LGTKIQTSQNVEIVTKEEKSLRKVLNVIGIFIFGGLAFTNVTNPIPSNQIKDFLLFISGSALIYYFLVNIYFLGRPWRKVFYASLIVLLGFSLFMVFYLTAHSMPH
jgi:hypothetical protein